LSNAFKFTRAGGSVGLTVKVIKQSNDLKIVVTDTGIGMPEEMVKNLFSRNLYNNRIGTNGEKSSGIGLDIVKHFVNLHAGCIHVESTEGKGSKFTVSIPYVECLSEMIN
jgi:signal transduction histidine kinase